MRRGHILDLPKSSYQSWIAAFTGEYDEEDLQAIIDLAPPGSVILDIGASLGMYAIPLAIAGRPGGFRVVAFEPVPTNLAVLRENILLNGLDGEVRVEPVALGSESGTIEMLLEDGGTGNAAVPPPQPTGDLYGVFRRGAPRASVPLRRLDDLANLSPCSVIKIDVEGFELDVLQGATEFIARNRPTIVGEFGAGGFASRGLSTDDVLVWAAGHSYDVFERSGQRHSRFSDQRHHAEVKLTRSASRTGATLVLNLEPPMR